MEGIIHHFKLYAEGFSIVTNFSYAPVEAPKGEFGSFFITKNNKPYRCKIHSPGFFHLQGLDIMCRKHFLADVVTVIGSQDIVCGEVDR